jgi:hypothetical protein
VSERLILVLLERVARETQVTALTYLEGGPQAETLNNVRVLREVAAELRAAGFKADSERI